MLNPAAGEQARHTRQQTPCPRRGGSERDETSQSSCSRRRASDARVLDVAVADALRNHRPHHGVGAHDEVDHDGTVVRVERELDRRVDLVFLLDADREATVSLASLTKSGMRRVPYPCSGRCWSDVPRRTSSATGAPCPARSCCDDRDLDGMSLMTQVRELLIGHLEAAVAVDRPHGALGLGDLGPHGRGHGVAHVPAPPELSQALGRSNLNELRGPHLVLADAGGVHALGTGQLADALDDVLGRQQPVRGRGVAERNSSRRPFR